MTVHWSKHCLLLKWLLLLCLLKLIAHFAHFSGTRLTYMVRKFDGLLRFWKYAVAYLAYKKMRSFLPVINERKFLNFWGKHGQIILACRQHLSQTLCYNPSIHYSLILTIKANCQLSLHLICVEYNFRGHIYCFFLCVLVKINCKQMGFYTFK